MTAISTKNLSELEKNTRQRELAYEVVDAFENDDKTAFNDAIEAIAELREEPITKFFHEVYKAIFEGMRKTDD